MIRVHFKDSNDIEFEATRVEYTVEGSMIILIKGRPPAEVPEGVTTIRNHGGQQTPLLPSELVALVPSVNVLYVERLLQ